MTAVLSVASRELREKKFVFVAAIAVAVLPLFAALLPSEAWGRAGTVATLGGILAMAFALILAIALGTSTLGDDASFYLSRPLSPAALWFGKVLASLATIFVCLAVTIAIPATLALTSAQELMPESLGRIVAAVTLLAVALFAASNAVATMVRSRKALVLVDLTLAIATGIALWAIVRPLSDGREVIAAFLAGVVGLFLIAPAWQLSRARADRQRGHLELSKFLWIGVAVLLSVAGGFVVNTLSAGPEDLKTFSVRTYPTGNWFLISGGHPRDQKPSPSFFVNVRDGRSTRINRHFVFSTAVAENGMAAWFEGKGLNEGPFEVRTRNLDERGSRTIDTGIRAQRFGDLALSRDGKRLAVIADGQVSVHDLERNALLGSAVVPGIGGRVIFVTPDVVRVTGISGIYEFDLKQRLLTRTGAIDANNIRWISDDGERALVRTTLVDTKNGAGIIELGFAGESARMLSDGIVIGIEGDKLRVGEAAPGKVVLGGRGFVETVDLTTRRVIQRADGLALMHSQISTAVDARPRVCIDKDRNFYTWNPLTGKKTALF
ncbi:MAG TPA: hypothetical protein VF618_11385 [Thermoanaerobaculia bacterium]